MRPAQSHEAAAISQLALRSKALWGYSPEFLEACRDELTFTGAQIRDPLRTIVVAQSDSAIAGFYALSPLVSGRVELDALFVEPSWTGRGVSSLGGG